MLSTDSDILKAAEDWRKEGRAVALATVVETWGSAPRPVGSNLAPSASSGASHYNMATPPSPTKL